MSGPPSSPGVIATSRDTLAIARITARKGRAADLTRTVRNRWDIDLPNGPRRVQSPDLAVIGVGVDTWLATSEKELDGLAASLRSALDDSATVSDQIGANHVLRLTGRHVRGVLAKLVSLDLHPRVFAVGSAATTLGPHIPGTLWRLEDDSNGAAVFELAVPRSYSHDFGHLLAANAAEFGFVRLMEG